MLSIESQRHKARYHLLRQAALCLLGGVALLGVCSAQTVWAEEKGAAAPTQGAASQSRNAKTFDLPAQPLDSALRAFESQSGLEVTFPQGGVDPALRCPAVQGQLTSNQALDRLLAGSGLTWRAQGPGAVLIEREADLAVNKLGTIMVTGERVGRSVMDTAASVEVFDADTIEQMAGVEGTNQLLARVPNVLVVEPSNYAPTVRGIDGTGPAVGANAFFAGVRPRLTMQVDGRPLTFNELVFSDVSLWDVDQVEVFRGAQSTVQGRNSIAGTVVVKTKDPTYDFEGKVRAEGGSDEARRLSAVVSAPIIKDQVAFRLAADLARWQSVVDFQGYDDVDDPGEYEYLNVRGKLLFEPKAWEGFWTLVTLNHSEYVGPQGELVARPFEDYKAYNAQAPTFNPKATSGVAETKWQLNEALRLENILAYTDLDVRRHAPKNTGNVWIDGHEALWEPRLHFSAFNKRLTGFAGYHGMWAQQDERIDLMGGGTFDDKTTTNAAFFEFTYALLEQVDLTLGARYEQEERQRKGGTTLISVDYDETYSALMPKLVLSWHLQPELTLGASVSRGYNGGGAGITWSAPFVAYTYDPEYVWDYEIFARKDLMEGKVRLTGNLFYSMYKDIQLPYNLASQSVVIRNADEAITYGLEAGAEWLILEGLRVYGQAGLLKTEITSYPGSGYEDKELPRAPAYSFTAGVMYRHACGLELSADFLYTDAYYSDATNSPRGKVDPYGMANLQAGYRFGFGRIYGFVNNVFDNETPLTIGTGTTAASDYATMSHPRSFGIGLELWF